MHMRDACDAVEWFTHIRKIFVLWIRSKIIAIARVWIDNSWRRIMSSAYIKLLNRALLMIIVGLFTME